MGDKPRDGAACVNLGNTYQCVDDFKTAINHYNRCLSISKEVGDKAREAATSDNLGIAFHRLGDFHRTKEY